MRHLLFTILALLTATFANAIVVKSGDLYYSTYTIASSTVAVVITVPEGGEAYSGDIVIPPSINISQSRSIPVIGIQANAFAGMKGVKTVKMPATVTNIGESAFKDCDNLEEISLPQGLTSIPAQAFMNTSLKSVTLPSTITSIGEGAFISYANSLTRITCAATDVPTLGEGAFNCDYDVALYVNRDMVNSFKNAEGWKDFKYILPLTTIGDVNKDKNLNSVDVVSIYNYIIEGEKSGVSPLLADVNEDNAVNASDVVTVYNYIINGVPSDRILPIETLSATDITTTSATLNAWARLNGDDDILSISVINEKGELSTTTINKDDVDAEGNFCIKLENLMPGTNFKYFASYNGSLGHWNGDTLNFATEDIITLNMDLINLTSSDAALYGSISAEGVTPTEYGFVYSTSKNPRIDTGAGAAKATVRTDGTFSAGIHNLKGETTYYYRAYILADDIYYYTKDDFTFTTKAQVLQITADATPTAIDAEIRGTMSIDGTAPTEYGLLYGKDENLEIGKEGVISQKVILGALPSQAKKEFKCTISDLAQENTYYYRAYAIVDGKYIYGKDILSFVTKNVSTYFQLNTIGSDLNITCQDKNKSFNICYSLTNPKPTVSDCDTIAYGTKVPGEYYYKNVYCRAFILSGGEYHYSNIVLKENIGECPVADAVDLGLSVKWASWDLGATKAGEYGDYFAWGEICPQYYKSYSPESHTLPGVYVDKSYNLLPAVDAAHMQWGGDWRMPTQSEIEELCNKCTREYLPDYNGTGINCMKVTGPNGNFILLPMAGRYDNELNKQKGLLFENESYYLWGSTEGLLSVNANSCTAYYSEEREKAIVTSTIARRYCGLNIRPVCPK